MNEDTKAKIYSILEHLYWFKDSIEDEENRKDFTDSIERLTVLFEEEK